MARGLVSASLLTLMVVGWSSALPLVSNDAEEEDPALLRYFAEVTQMLHLAGGEPSTNTGELVAAHNSSSDRNPEELGKYLEGDILVPRSLTRNGLVSEMTRWPRGEVPYVTDPTFPVADLNMIEKAINEYHSRTCVRFVKRTNQRDYIKITKANTGCWSSVGRIRGMQEVNLQSPSCTKMIGTVLHELMHALGFTHEQNRSERDSYVTIMWANIEADRKNNFEMARRGTVTGFGVTYDFGSVMHYSANAFSVNGSPTIVSKVSGVTMGQRAGFSAGDVKKIRAMYKCA